MTILRAVEPEEARRVVTGREIVAELVAVMERQIPFMSPDDPNYRHLRDLHDLMSAR